MRQMDVGKLCAGALPSLQEEAAEQFDRLLDGGSVNENEEVDVSRNK